MADDPIVEEVRKVRDAYAKAFNYNLEAIVDDLIKNKPSVEGNWFHSLRGNRLQFVHTDVLRR